MSGRGRGRGGWGRGGGFNTFASQVPFDLFPEAPTYLHPSNSPFSVSFPNHTLISFIACCRLLLCLMLTLMIFMMIPKSCFVGIVTFKIIGKPLLIFSRTKPPRVTILSLSFFFFSLSFKPSIQDTIIFLVLSSERQSMHIAKFSDRKKNDFTRDSLSQVLMFNDFPQELVQGINNGTACQGSGYVF